MPSHTRKLIIWGVFLALSALACTTISGLGLPTSEAADQTPTPNLTLTAIFMPSVTLVPAEETTMALLTGTATSTETPTPEPTATIELSPTLEVSPTPLPYTPTETFTPTETQDPLAFTPAPFSGPVENVGFTPAPTTTTEALSSSEEIRVGPSVSAVYLGEAPTIDGWLGDWGAYQYSASKVVFGPDYFSGPDDMDHHSPSNQCTQLRLLNGVLP